MKYRLREQMNIFNDTTEELATYLDITYQTLSRKINEHTEFTRAEIKKIKERYNLTPMQVDYIFFQ